MTQNAWIKKNIQPAQCSPEHAKEFFSNKVFMSANNGSA